MTDLNASTFRKSLFNKQDFTLTFELVPSRGGWSKGQSRIVSIAEKAAKDGRIHAVSLTENAGGHPALSPEVIGLEIKGMGLDVINHFSCKDKNRNQMESLLFALDREGLNNLLIITGDYPQKGYKGHPKPVFDLDSVQLIDLINSMNQGFLEPNKNNDSKKFKPSSFLKGVALSPFKYLHSELILQYTKLQRKIQAGADYIITQLGYDVRKFHEVLLYLEQNNTSIPILGNVFIPNLPVARLMHKGCIPGCIIPNQLYDEIVLESKSTDRGKKASLDRAAKLMAVLKGMGYDGAHIGGPGLSFNDLDYLITESDILAKNWRQLIPQLAYQHSDICYYYAKNHQTGLNHLQPHAPSKQKKTYGIGARYTIADFFHNLMFDPKGPLFHQAQKLCLALEEKGFSQHLMHAEHLVKLLLFQCRNCGDCRIQDLAYLCPQSGCAKYMLNGPCGGSNNGWCEVYPGQKKCFYVKMYRRLRKCNKLSELLNNFQPPRDWQFNNSSSWLNFFKEYSNNSSTSEEKGV